jgi:molybdopterin converting factor small subunit
MPAIHFTQALKRFFPDLKPFSTDHLSIPAVLQEMEMNHPGIKGYILDDQGHLRKHVNIFVNGQMISDREQLSDKLDKGTEVYIMQALSGG